jgi:DNA-binding NtrC family response regulator
MRSVGFRDRAPVHTSRTVSWAVARLPPRVLVIAVHRELRQALVDILSDAGVEVRCAGSAASAVALMTVWIADVVLADMDDVAARATVRDLHAAIPSRHGFIAMTSDPSNVAIAEIDRVLKKPFGCDALFDQIDRLLDGDLASS